MVMSIQNLLRRNGQEVAEPQDLDEPMLPHFSTMPTAQDPRRRRWTEKVMEAGAYVEELEAKVAAQAEEIGVQRNQIRLFEEAQRLLRRQLGDLAMENNKLRDALSRTQTKLEVSGQLVLQALDELRQWRLANQPQETEDAPPPSPATEEPAQGAAS